MMKYLTLLSTALVLASCSTSQSQNKPAIKDFNGYWYAGEAEITSYELSQARYGEIHKGEAVMVFVTEPFSKSKQVKLDNWRDESEDNVSVMKLNLTKKFLTGIYPYSMMMSTFTPVDYNRFPNAFKITTSSQEWCGHTWLQIAYMSNTDIGYELKGFSYFESEGDVNYQFKLNQVSFEDELWTRIRLNPETLPVGDFKVLPGTFYLRLKHRETKPQNAKASMLDVHTSEFSDDPHMIYTLEYENRKLAIYFDESFPHTILGWEETYLSGFDKPEQLTTKAKRINTIKSAYWGKNSNKDRAIREELGLSTE